MSPLKPTGGLIGDGGFSPLHSTCPTISADWMDGAKSSWIKGKVTSNCRVCLNYQRRLNCHPETDKHQSNEVPSECLLNCKIDLNNKVMNKLIDKTKTRVESLIYSV